MHFHKFAAAFSGGISNTRKLLMLAFLVYGGLDCQDNFGQGFKVGLAPFYSLTFRTKVASLGSWDA